MKKFLTFLFLTYSIQIFAIQDLVVKEKLTVFKRPQLKSKKVTTLTRGDKVVISPRSYGSFRKVLVTYDGKRQAGYILSKKILLSKIQERFEEEANPLIKSKSFGGDISIAIAYSGEGALEVDNLPNAKIDSTFGFDFHFGLQHNWPLSETLLLETNLRRRSYSLSGNAVLIPSSSGQSTEVTSKGYSVSGLFKLYSKKSSFYWWGLGAEAFLVTDVEVRVNTTGNNLEYTGEKGFHALLFAGIGYDFQLTEKLFIVPAVYLGVFTTRDPLAYYSDVKISTVYIY